MDEYQGMLENSGLVGYAQEVLKETDQSCFVQTAKQLHIRLHLNSLILIFTDSFTVIQKVIHFGLLMRMLLFIYRHKLLNSGWWSILRFWLVKAGHVLVSFAEWHVLVDLSLVIVCIFQSNPDN